MDLCDINEIRALLEPRGFKFSKAMGQNFLTADWVPKRIAEESGIGCGNGVLEIGPGIGCLTRELSVRAGKVVSIELDKRLIPVLEYTLSDLTNVTVINGDIMKENLSELANIHFSGLDPCVCANLPYNITTPVLTKLIENDSFSSVTVMVQREAAGRLTAQPRTADYGLISVMADYYMETKKLFDVPPGCFQPQPKITSTVIRMVRRSGTRAYPDDNFFFRVVRAALSSRRKTLANSLSGGFSSLSKDAICSAIRDSGLCDRIRGEELGVSQFSVLAEKLAERMK